MKSKYKVVVDFDLDKDILHVVDMLLSCVGRVSRDDVQVISRLIGVAGAIGRQGLSGDRCKIVGTKKKVKGGRNAKG